MGHLADKYDPWLLAIVILTLTSLATFILWGALGHTLAGLLSFGVVYGLVGGGWPCLWTAFAFPISSEFLYFRLHY